MLCGHPPDRRFILYHRDEVNTDDQLLNSASNEYESRRLPCDEIIVHCSVIKGVEQDCRYEHHVDLFNVSTLLADSAVYSDCVWLDLDAIRTMVDL